MSDFLIKLYELERSARGGAPTLDAGIQIRRALAPEKSLVSTWVRRNFSAGWASECDISFAQQPVACYLAILDRQVLGFACYNTTFKGFLGPIGVDSEIRGRGIGKALLLSALHAMSELGYMYAIVGGVGPGEFFHRSVDCIEIPDSTPGPYRGILKEKPD